LKCSSISSFFIFDLIESQIWEDVIPTVVTICIWWFLMEAVGAEMRAIKKRGFGIGVLKNSFGQTAEKLPKDRKNGSDSLA